MAFEMIQQQLKEEFTYELYLCKSSHPYDVVGCLTNAITDTSFRWVLREPDELSFIMHEKFEDGSVNSLFTQIIETNTIKVDKIIDDVIIESYLYHISNVEPIGGISNSKNIKGYSLDIRLAKQKVRAFEYSTQIYTGTWDVNSPAISGIVDYILTLFEGNWSVDYVSTSLLNSIRKFDITESSVLETIKTIENEFNCIFMYDTVNQTINIIDYDDNYQGFNDNSGLILDSMNYLEQYNSQIDIDDITTRLYVEGDKDTNIASLNIIGTRYIDDFSFFMNTKYMTQSLIDSLTTLNALRVSNEATYQGLLATLLTKQGELSTLNGELFTLNTELIVLEDSEDLAIRNGGTYNTKTYAQWHSDLLAKKVQITNKEGQIISKIAEINVVNSNIDTLNYLVSYDNPLNLSNNQRRELVNFIQEDTQSINSDDPEVLLELGKAYLTIKSQSQYDISVNMVDIFSVKSESYNWDKLVLGSKVNLVINDVIYEPIITSIDHGWDSNSLNITVSNKLYLNDDMDFLTSLWAKTKSTSTVFDKNIGDLKDSSEIAKELEADKSNPINVKDNVITIGDEAALVQQAQITRRGLYTGDSLSANGQMRILSDMIVFTNDNWNSHSVAIDSTGIRSSQSFRIISNNAYGGNNLLTIDGSGIKLYGDNTASGGIEIYNKLNQKVMGFDSNGNLTMTGNITITGGSGIGSFTDAGSLATANSVDWSTQVSGSGKPANNATVGATWGTNLISIPNTLLAPSGDGLYLSSTNLGFYQGGIWKTYMDNNGNFFLGGSGGKLQWTSATNTLQITGNITGSRFYGSGVNSGYIEIGSAGGGNLADLNVFRGGTIQPSFSIYDFDTMINLRARGSAMTFPETFLSTNGENTEVYGSWDFNFATVDCGVSTWDFSFATVNGLQVKFA